MKNLINYLSKKSLSLGNGSGMTRKWFGNGSGMTRFSLASLICLCMLTIGSGNVWGQASAGTVMYSENFGGYSANNVPSGSVSTSSGNRVVYNSGSVTYTCTNGEKSGNNNGGTTKIYAENNAGGTSPELLVGKKGGASVAGGTFSISGIPSGGATKLTVSFKQNKNGLSASVSGTGYSGSFSESTAGTKSFDVTVGSASTFTLTFTATSTSNVRLDDISVVVKTAGGGSTKTLVYNANGGSGSMDNTTGASVSAASCTFTAPTCKVFDHWNTAANDGGDSYDPGDAVTASTTLYAIWRNNPSDPTVTFSNGSYTTGGSALNLSSLFSSNSEGAVTYSITNAGGTGASIEGTSFSATTAGSCTVQASQAADAPCYNAKTATATITVSAPTPATITLQNYDGDATTTGYYSGGSFTLPSENDFVCGDLTFVGWSSVTIDNSATKPSAATYHEPGESVTLGASNTFYAVFATAGAGGATTYTKVTTISAGTYLMAIENATQYTPTSKLAYTGDNGSGKRGGVVTVSISDGVISTKPATALEITVTLGTGDDAGYFAMYDGSKYITQGAKNEFAFVDDISYQWNLNASGQIHQKGTFDSSDDNRIYVEHGNSGSQTNLFKPTKVRTEGNNSGSYFYHAYLFKKSGGVTYSDYTTSCVCTAPEYVTISGAWDKFGGETISLTATPYDDGDNEITTGITGWKWQKLVSSTWTDIENGTSDGVTTSGATSQNLQISNCKVNNSGKYRCVVSTGATCSTASATATDGSQGHLVRVYALECYTGGTTVYNFTRDGDNQRGSVEITLSASTAYTFKVHADNDYYGNNGTVNEDVTNWVMCNNSTTACTTNLTVNSGLGGTFTFTMDYSTSGSSSVEGEPELSITYPRKTIYLTPGVWNSESAKFAFYYFRKEGGTIYGEGFTDFITPSDCGSSAEIPQWNGVKINAVRLNSSTTASDLTNSANHYKAAWDKKWNQTSDITVTSNNSVTITDWGSGDSPYTYGTFSTPTYTISYDAGTSGSGSKSNESKTCGVDFTLPNTQVFTRNGYTMDGWATEDGGAKVYNLGGSYTTNAAQTFYPHWALASYGVTLNTNGGTINAGNVTSYTYGTGATLPTDVTKSHATFQGWYAASNFSGERVYSIGAAEYGNKEYWAKWETVTWTVTWKANGETVRTDASVTDGDKVASVPSAPSNLTTGSNGCDAEFVGWVIEANDPGALSISTRDTAPSGMFTNVAGSPAITANTTFVAIYRQEQ